MEEAFAMVCFVLAGIAVGMILQSRLDKGYWG